ncbi:MAG: hypothetical protein ABSE43_12690 [Steroidobacteraceae bacterium]
MARSNFSSGSVARTRRNVARLGLLAGCLLCASAGTRAETLSVLGGFSESDDYSASTYAWALEYREAVGSRFAASLEWLNEGHTQANRRDGGAAQFWWNAPKWFDRVSFSVGAGPYLYFDTETTVTAKEYSDDHGIGGVFSGAMLVDLGGHWVLTVKVSDMYTPGDVGTYHVLVGAGYDFTDVDHLLSKMSAASEDSFPDGRQQVQVFGGRTIFNDRDASQAYTYGADYRLQLNHWSDWSAAWFDDPGSPPGLNERLATQFWIVDHIQRARLALSVGLGAYVQLGAKPASSSVPFARLSGLTGIRGDWQWTPRTSVILTWYRRFTEDDADRDILTLGVGWRF